MHLAYLAGLIDGEGCIGFTRIRNQLIPRLTITNTDQSIISDLKESFGGHIIMRPPHKLHWKASSHWVLQNGKSVELLEKCYKYLRIKKNQAKCLFLHSAIRPGKGRSWDVEGIEACYLLEDQIHWLNKKGINDQIEPMEKELSNAS